MAVEALFQPLRLGALTLRNRVVMAPMTRSRADAGDMPNGLMVEYYRQRAGAGLIVTEGIAPTADGIGYCRTPGIYNQAQVDAWREVVRQVHAEGGCIVAQLMHCGRVGSRFNKPAGSEMLAPSPIRARGEIYTDSHGMTPHDEPRELSQADIAALVSDFGAATERCFEAGFDGVELHCTSGYLPMQFLSSGSNRRRDAYGGDATARSRFPLEVLAAMAAVDGGGRVGLRICPDNPFNDMTDEDPADTYATFLAGAAGLELAYVHSIRFPSGRVDNLALAAEHFPGRVIGNDSFAAAEAAAMIESGRLAAVSFGRAFIGNPDLPARLSCGAELAPFDTSRLYTPGAAGYTDYPALAG